MQLERFRHLVVLSIACGWVVFVWVAIATAFWRLYALL